MKTHSRTHSRIRATSIGLLTTALASAASAASPPAPGAGNEAAVALSLRSPLVRSARAFLTETASHIESASLRQKTLDAIDNPETCVAHRAGLDDAQKAALIGRLAAEGLVDMADDATFPGGLVAGIFPPVLQEGTACPRLPQSFYSAPGSVFGGHHSYPGGLAVHESFNELNNVQLASAYRRVYGSVRWEGLPEIGRRDGASQASSPRDDFFVSDDITIGAPIWHDWAKAIVFQWNADGTEFQELSFGGNGVTDSNGAAGNSKTGAHHILGLAEAMKRGLAPDFVVTQACAHSTPTQGNEYKVVNWLRTAAILSGTDAVAAGYLRVDGQGHHRLPALRALGSVDLNAAAGSLPNVLLEYTSHNLSDADFTLTGPAVTEVQVLLALLAPRFGYDAADAARYNTRFRNPVLTFLSAERLFTIYAQRGLDGVRDEIARLRRRGVL